MSKITNGIRLYLSKRAVKKTLIELCKAKKLSVKGNKDVLIDRILKSYSVKELLEFFDPIQQLTWYEKLMISLLLESPKTSSDIIKSDLFESVSREIEKDENVPSWYISAFKVNFVKWNRRSLIKSGILHLERRGKWYYSVDPSFDAYFREKLINTTKDEIIQTFKKSAEYESLSIELTQSIHKSRHELLGVNKPVYLQPTDELKIVAFSDYRVQDVELLLDFIRGLDSKPDIIIYSGDDITRFGPFPKSSLIRLWRENSATIRQNPYPLTDHVYGFIYRRTRKTAVDESYIAKIFASKIRFHKLFNENLTESLKGIVPEANRDSLKKKILECVSHVITKLSRYPCHIDFEDLTPQTNFDFFVLKVNSKIFSGILQFYFLDSGKVIYPKTSNYLRFALRELNKAELESTTSIMDTILKKPYIYHESDSDWIKGFICFPQERKNIFEELAKETKHGICVVAGNDDLPQVRDIINGEKVYNVHTTPVVIGKYAIVGLEGAPIKPNDINPGIILYNEESIAKHLQEHYSAVSGKELIIVSHAPPKDTLDHALRFGERNIGSVKLREFIEDKSDVILVFSGHVHYCGGKSTWLKNTLVVNVASHDRYSEPGRIAMVRVKGKGDISIDWKLIHEVSEIFGIGPKRTERFKKAGIKQLEDFIKYSPQEISFRLGCSISVANKLLIRARAILENKVFVLSPLELNIGNRIFFDIETDLAQSTVWLIGAYSASTGKFVRFFADSPEEEERILRNFLDFLESQPRSTLYFYAGSDFDGRVLRNRLQEYGLNTGIPLEMVDICPIIRQSIALPLKSYRLKDVSRYFGYGYKHPDLDGFGVAMEYFGIYLKNKDPALRRRLEEYNEDDVRSLPHILGKIIKLQS